MTSAERWVTWLIGIHAPAVNAERALEREDVQQLVEARTAYEDALTTPGVMDSRPLLSRVRDLAFGVDQEQGVIAALRDGTRIVWWKALAIKPPTRTRTDGPIVESRS